MSHSKVFVPHAAGTSIEGLREIWGNQSNAVRGLINDLINMTGAISQIRSRFYSYSCED